MQLESLQVYCDVARLRSISGAARANAVTQSAASQIVLQLEKRLQVRLIDRSTRPLKLTTAGQRYYEGCKHLLDGFRALESSIRSAPTPISGKAEVAAIYSVGLSDMGELVERFHREQPAARVHVDYLHPDQVYERVLSGTADLGLVSFPRRMRDLTTVPWREEEMVIACASTDPLASRSSTAVAELNGRPYIGFSPELVIRRRVDRFLRDHGVRVDVIMEFDNIETIKRAVEIGAGLALLPEPTIRNDVNDGRLAAVRLKDCRLVRPLGIIEPRHRPMPPAAARFVELLREAAAAAGQGNGRPKRSRTRRPRARSRNRP